MQMHRDLLRCNVLYFIYINLYAATAYAYYARARILLLSLQNALKNVQQYYTYIFYTAGMREMIMYSTGVYLPHPRSGLCV